MASNLGFTNIEISTILQATKLERAQLVITDNLDIIKSVANSQGIRNGLQYLLGYFDHQVH